MTERDWQMIAVLTECGSLTQAAKRLYVSQPALSLALQRLEKELGQPLFYRTGKGLKCTPAGEKAAAACQKMLKLSRDLINDEQTEDAQRSGRLVLGITNYLGAMILPDLLCRYQQRFPKMEIEIREAASDELEQMIRTMQVDIGILHAPLRPVDFTTVALTTHPFVLALNQTVAKQWRPQNDTLDPRLLCDLPWILLYPQQRIRQISDDIFSQCAFSPKIRMLTRSFETARNLAAAGIGATFLPENYVRYFGSREGLACFFLPAAYRAEWTLMAGFASGWKLSYPAEALIETLKTTVAQLEEAE